VNLCLDDDASAEPFRDGFDFGSGRGDIALGNRDARVAQQGSGLVFVEVHWPGAKGLWAKAMDIRGQEGS
jgi:hypothetical protein